MSEVKYEIHAIFVECVCVCDKGVSNQQASEESEDYRQLSFIASSSGGAAQLIGPDSTHSHLQQTAEPTEEKKEKKRKSCTEVTTHKYLNRIPPKSLGSGSQVI